MVVRDDKVVADVGDVVREIEGPAQRRVRMHRVVLEANVVPVRDPRHKIESDGPVPCCVGHASDVDDVVVEAQDAVGRRAADEDAAGGEADRLGAGRCG